MLPAVTGENGDGHSRAGAPAPYPWMGATEQQVEIACAQIARRLLQARLKLVGFLPAPGVPALLPLMLRIAEALFRFEPRPVAIIGPWTTWDGTVGEPGNLDPKGHGPVLRPLPGAGAASLVVPPHAPDPDTALLSLQLALRRINERFARVLLDLGDWVGPRDDVLSVAVRLTDASTVVGAVGRTGIEELRRTAVALPDDKNLGALLIG